MENLAVSNERIIKTADAVEDLRQALELWSTRDDTAGVPLDVYSAGHRAVEAVDKALFELAQIRRETVAEVRAQHDATMARVDALLTPSPVILPLSYTCAEPECGQVFPVDPADPIESHGAYLDHQAEHDAEDACELCGSTDPAVFKMTGCGLPCDDAGQWHERTACAAVEASNAEQVAE